jgi:hypothetical protein
MNCSFRKCIIKIIILSTISFFYACDGGDGTSSPDGDGSGGGGVSGLNPELPGRFLFTYDWNKHTATSERMAVCSWISKQGRILKYLIQIGRKCSRTTGTLPQSIAKQYP